MPRSLSQTLLRRYAPNHVGKDIVMSRLYLGKETVINRGRFFNSRNFPIDLEAYNLLRSEHAAAIDLPSAEIVAREMGRALSNIHVTGYDGRDIELVLAGNESSLVPRQWGFFVFDFNQMRPLPTDVDHIVALLSKAFFLNDPYFPRPRRGSGLYVNFQQGYLDATENSNMAKAFFLAIEAEYGRMLDDRHGPRK